MQTEQKTPDSTQNSLMCEAIASFYMFPLWGEQRLSVLKEIRVRAELFFCVRVSYWST